MSYDKLGDIFYEDCRVFLSRFKSKDSLRFDAFAEVWQEMKFSFVLSQWKCLGEMQEIIEEYFKVCKGIWLKSETVEDRVCGLYLLRAIYLKQPAVQYVKISLSLEDWQWMKHFLYVIKDFAQNETRYILQELFNLNAFAFSVTDCIPAEGKDDGGLAECVKAQFSTARTLYHEMFLALERESNEYKEQRQACLRVYPELRSFTNAETDSLVGELKDRLRVLEVEVSKIRHNLLDSNVTSSSSLHYDGSATEETLERKSTRKKRTSYRVTAVADGCETEESSDSGDNTNLDMPQLVSEDSDDVEDEEACDVATVRSADKLSVHMSDFDLSSISSEDDEQSSGGPIATGSSSSSSSSKSGPAAASPEPGPASSRSARPPTARRGRGRGRGQGRGRGRGRRVRGRSPR